MYPGLSFRLSSAARCLQVHDATIAHGAYPSPYNYFNYPKSVCTSINEVGRNRHS